MPLIAVAVECFLCILFLCDTGQGMSLIELFSIMIIITKANDVNPNLYSIEYIHYVHCIIPCIGIQGETMYIKLYVAGHV